MGVYNLLKPQLPECVSEAGAESLCGVSSLSGLAS
jgi:hypothetical protein